MMDEQEEDELEKKTGWHASVVQYSLAPRLQANPWAHAEYTGLGNGSIHHKLVCIATNYAAGHANI